jgi:serine protease Do
MNCKTRFAFASLLLSFIAVSAHAQSAATQPSPAAQEKLAEAVAPSLVRVEYTLQYDQGVAPTAAGWSTKCPNCGQYHGNEVGDVVKEDRPFEASGFLVADDLVVTTDPILHPRFLKKIAVSIAGERVDATVAGYAKEQNAVTLKLAAPLKSAKPLKFDPSKAAPYSAVTYTHENGDWTRSVQSLGGTVSKTGDGRGFFAAASPAIVVAADGTPIALSMNNALPLDDSWKQPPSKWPTVSSDEHAKLLERIRASAGKGLVRVTLNLRSPKASPTADRFSSNDDEKDATVRHVVGVLLDAKTVLVLAELKSGVTGRLEKIRVRQADGKSVEAKFAHTLADYGALVAKLDQPLEGAPASPPKDSRPARDVFLPAVEVLMQGEKRTEHYAHRRIASFNVGFRRQLYPEVGAGSNNLFLFDESGALVALPITRRSRIAAKEEYAPDPTALLTPASYIRQAVAELPKTADAGNVPLAEEQENRLAWLGIELQGLNAELARANEVSHLTSDGESGALVTHVYPNSPAAQAGVEPGWIFIRAHVEGEPTPLEVKVDPYQFAEQPFPWDRFEELAEQYFDQVPRPWPPAENTLTRALTDLGFGRAFTAEFFHDGKTDKKPFKVAESPAHYDSAAKHKLDSLGVTVRDMTYEVRRYFQLEPTDPGVIISKIEMGSKASTAGLKPFELITHVNDQPVNTAADFDTLTKGQKELRLSMKRLAKGRQVKVKLADATSKPTTKKSTPGKAATKDD